ncbi:hypothetical protein GDO86_014579 [Hymenochirus boettgeri]|uniref:Uncharacterized protein n=1 Tax=Hymenochirus boettgeri TaxID=247094 RepID=A0A8T2JV51_9PIPI|nr:hypothetical protein GDO86_014579 [Hymenochirus boettgeri]
MCFSKTLGFRQSLPQWGHGYFPAFFNLAGGVATMFGEVLDGKTGKAFKMFRVRVGPGGFAITFGVWGLNITDKLLLSIVKPGPPAANWTDG